MAWMIGRTEALTDPDKARAKAAAKLQELAEVDNAEALVFSILVEALLLVESYRGARHPMPFVDELTRSVDVMLRELTILEKAKEFADI